MGDAMAEESKEVTRIAVQQKRGRVIGGAVLKKKSGKPFSPEEQESELKKYETGQAHIAIIEEWANHPDRENVSADYWEKVEASRRYLERANPGALYLRVLLLNDLIRGYEEQLVRVAAEHKDDPEIAKLRERKRLPGPPAITREKGRDANIKNKEPWQELIERKEKEPQYAMLTVSKAKAEYTRLMTKANAAAPAGKKPFPRINRSNIVNKFIRACRKGKARG